MLILKNIVKEYSVGDTTKTALDRINLSFKENEFVSVLGSTGSGKTTLLKILGGLDRYTSGEFSINGKSTKSFSDMDWNLLRSNAIAFVFQGDDLLPHQTILANTEIALTLAGAPKAGRRERAAAVLVRVGLGDQLDMTPDQLSGGQRQCAAIARALVNNPAIILADEPTAFLDGQSGTRIMNIFKEIAKDKLIIMATNNPELAMQYSSRIITLSEGRVVDDSNPYHVAVEKPSQLKKGRIARKAIKKAEKNTSMSILTAISFSIRSMISKKSGTFTALLAGSIAVTGIALSIMPGISHILTAAKTAVIAAISLLISFTLIGAVTYNSILDQIVEIGILRRIGASRKDICRIISGEACITGFVSGIAGICITLAVSGPVNMIFKAYTGTSVLVKMTPAGSFALLIFSVVLNFTAGYLASLAAVKKNPGHGSG